MHCSRTLIKHTSGAAMISAALVLFTAVCVSTLWAMPVAAQTPVRIEGQINNATHGAATASVSNLTVTLFQMGTAGPVTHTVQTDAAGRFSFGDLPVDPSSPFFTRVDYAGLQYFSDIIQPQPGALAPISMTVYETQTLPASFQIDRAHLILDIGQKSLNAVELVQVTNSTDRAFLLPLPVPDGSGNLSFNDLRDQFRVVQNPDGSLSYPVLPSTNQILYGETIVTHPPGYTLHLQLPVNIGQLNVLVSQTGGVQAASSQLSTGQPFTPQTGSVYTQLNGSNLPAGSTVAVSISNLPGADTLPQLRNILLIAGGLGALALLTLPFIRKRRGDSRVNPLPAVELESPDRLERLQAIAALDNAFDLGEIAEGDYRSERASLKSGLLDDSDTKA